MLELLLDFEAINKRPYLMFFWALIVTSAGVVVSTQIAPSVSGIDFGYFAVLFTIIPSVYLLTVLIMQEEELEEDEIKRHYGEKAFWGRHEKDLLILLFFFAGLTMAFAVWSFVVPDGTFGAQSGKILEIVPGARITAQVKGDFTSFMQIFDNNLQVMIVSFIFSVLFGAGAVFIIVWNASVLGVYIGDFLARSIWEIPIRSLAFIPHGVPEIAGYLVAGLAGGILSAALLRKNSKHVIEIILVDSLTLLAVGMVLLFVAAAIEVYL